MNYLDKILGSFVGLAIGDAIGVPAEFKYPGEFDPIVGMPPDKNKFYGPFHLRPGEWTDDTSLAIALAESLIHTNGQLDKHDLIKRFISWWQEGKYSHNGRCFDLGTTTKKAMLHYMNHGTFVGDDDPFAKSNGSIMRMTASVLCHWNDKEKAIQTAIDQGVVTHPAEECTGVMKDMATVIFHAIHGTPLDCITDDFRETALMFPKSLKSLNASMVSATGYVFDTYTAARWAISSTDNFKDAILKVVNLGDDADTTGAVTGQIAGAMYGLSGIPEEWINEIAWKDYLIETATKLYHLGQK